MAGSLRDQLSEQVSALETAQEETTTQAPDTATVGGVAKAASVEPAEVVAEQKSGRTAGRDRDEQGRLLPGPAKKSAQQPETAAQPKDAAAQLTAPVVAEPPKPKVNRPSSWKKDHWESFDKIATENPALAQYLVQRETEFAQGVSTYKGEYDKAKPILEAIAPFQAELQQYGIEPAKHVQSLFNAHRTLALGDPQSKLQMFAQLAKDYRVPLENLFVRAQDGQIYMNPQLQAPAQQPQQRAQQPDVRKTVQEILAQERMQSELQSFSSNTEKYPHFEVVRETMSGLLQAGLATDLASAYEAALRHPRHAEIFDAMQEQQRTADAQRVSEEKRRAADTARRNQISPKSAPSTGTASGGTGKGLRGALSEAFDAHTPSRV